MNTPSPQTSSAYSPQAPSRRAFALPTVLLLAMVGGLAVVLLLERHSTSHRAVARQIESYQNVHRSAGVKETILRWMQTTSGRPDQSVDDDQLACTMDISGRGSIKIYARDAQGALLRETSAISGRRREILEDARFLLEQLPEEQRVEGMFRPAGPPEMSIDTVPAIVVEAVALAIVAEPVKARAASDAILRARSQDAQLSGNTRSSPRPSAAFASDPSAVAGKAGSGAPRALSAPSASAKMSHVDVMGAIADIDLTPRQRRELAAMFTGKPDLWEFLAETTDSSGNVLNRSSGLYFAEAGKSDSFMQGGAFLTWEQLPLTTDASSRRGS